MWKAQVLVNTILIAEVTSSRHLEEVLLKGIALVCPALADVIKSSAQSERQLPSASAISRHRLSLHAAFLMTLREVNDKLHQGDRPALYHTCDCSPQAGREWLLSGYGSIPGATLLQCFGAALELISIQPDSDDDDGDALAAGARLDVQQACVRILKNNVIRRPHCPVVVGCGRGSVSHKLHACVHAVRLEHHSWERAAAAMRYISRVTDHGVESGMCRMPPFRPKDLFPWVAAEAEGGFDFINVDGGGQGSEPGEPPAEANQDYGQGGAFNFADLDNGGSQIPDQEVRGSAIESPNQTPALDSVGFTFVDEGGGGAENGAFVV